MNLVGAKTSDWGRVSHQAPSRSRRKLPGVNVGHGKSRILLESANLPLTREFSGLEAFVLCLYIYLSELSLMW